MNTVESTEKFRDRYYRRNFFTFMIEACLFQFSTTIFSAENVLPVYVSELSDNPIYISLISLIYYFLYYISPYFSCVIGVNAKSPKWISVFVCFFQRIAFLCFFISTFFLTDQSAALAVFYVSLVVHSIAAGMSNPLWTQMVANVINRNIGKFFGIYSMIGSASGIAASILFSYLLRSFEFPLNYRYLFMTGFIFAVTATLVICIGIKEPKKKKKSDKLKMKDVFPVIKNIYHQNSLFKEFTIARVLLAGSEFAIPYYIIKASNSVNSPIGYAGILTTIFLISKMAGSYFFGKLSDRYGPLEIIKYSSLIGGAASLLALICKDYISLTIMYFLVGFAVEGTYLTNGIGSVVFSEGKETPIYSAALGFSCAPIYIIFPVVGSLLAKYFSINSVFGMAMAIYIICFLYCLKSKRRTQ